MAPAIAVDTHLKHNSPDAPHLPVRIPTLHTLQVYGHARCVHTARLYFSSTGLLTTIRDSDAQVYLPESNAYVCSALVAVLHL